MAMTEQKQRYADARRKGVTKKEAAVLAGCPEQTASQAASRYEKDPDVIAAIARANHLEAIGATPEPAPAPAAATVTPAEPQADPEPFIPAGADDPLVFLHQVMNDPRADPKLRVDAAKTLASYKHAKPGEKGKKEQAAEAAKTAANGTEWGNLLAQNVRPIRPGVN